MSKERVAKRKAAREAKLLESQSSSSSSRSGSVGMSSVGSSLGSVENRYDGLVVQPISTPKPTISSLNNGLVSRSTMISPPDQSDFTAQGSLLGPDTTSPEVAFIYPTSTITVQKSDRPYIVETGFKNTLYDPVEVGDDADLKRLMNQAKNMLHIFDNVARKKDHLQEPPDESRLPINESERDAGRVRTSTEGIDVNNERRLAAKTRSTRS